MGLNFDHEKRLTEVAQLLYPVTDDMCMRTRTEARNKRVVFMWKMVKELKHSTDNMIEIVINELETKAGIKP